MKVKIENFQILKKVDFEIEGLTFVIGNTNEGKSAIVRAIEAALYNRTGNDFINFGASGCKVELELFAEDRLGPLRIDWQKRRSGRASYEINGVDYEKLNKGVPPVLAENGIKEVDVAREKHRLFFWRQIEEPFLVFRTPSAIFEFISRLMEEKQILPVLKLLADDIKENRDLMVKLEGEIQAIKQGIGDLRSRKIALDVVVGEESRVERMTQLQGHLADLLDIYIKVGVIDADRGRLRAAIDVESRVVGVLKSDIDRMGELLRGGAELAVISRDVSVRDAATLDLRANLRLYEAVRGLYGVEFDVNRYRDLLAARGRVDGVVRDVDKVRGAVAGLSGRAELDALLGRVDVVRLGELRGILAKARDVYNKVELLRRSLADGKVELEGINRGLSEFKVCPLCARPFDESCCG